jgi:hypothetical protein
MCLVKVFVFDAENEQPSSLHARGPVGASRLGGGSSSSKYALLTGEAVRGTISIELQIRLAGYFVSILQDFPNSPKYLITI